MRVEPAELLALASAEPPKAKQARKAERTPLPCADAVKLRDALAAINPDDRDFRLRAGMACHAAGDRKVWDTWSKTRSKYDPVDQGKSWDSFNADRDGNKVTVASL